MSHELFHKYHAFFHPEWEGKNRGTDIPLHWFVWAEGLATFASQQLNQKATTAAVFRSETLATSCEQNLKSLSGSLLDNFDSTVKVQMMEWMSVQNRCSNVPPRAGYYFVWRIAEAVGKGRSLRDLVRLSDGDVRVLVVQELRRFSS